MTAADDDPAVFRIVDGEVTGPRLRGRSGFGLRPRAGPEIVAPRIGQVVALAVSAEEHEDAVLWVGHEPRVHARRRLDAEHQALPVVIAKAVHPRGGIPDDAAVRSGLGHVAAAGEHDLVVHGVVREAPAEHRGRRTARLEVGPAPLQHVVGRRQTAGEEDERPRRRVVRHLIEDEIEIGPRHAFGLRGPAPEENAFAAGGDAGIGARKSRHRELAAPGRFVSLREVVAPAPLAGIEEDHVVLRGFDRGLLLQQAGVGVHETPEKEGGGGGSVADGACAPRAHGIVPQLDPAVGRELLDLRAHASDDAEQHRRDDEAALHGSVLSPEGSVRMLTRREFGKLALALPPAAARQAPARIHSTFGGVMVGAQTYSFRDRALDAAIEALRQIGLGFAELSARHVQPADAAAAKAWRTTAPLDDFRRVRRKFDDAGIVLVAFTYNIRADSGYRNTVRGWKDEGQQAFGQMGVALGLHKD